MDTSVTIIGLVIILIIVIPLYYVMRAQRANKEKLKKIFTEFEQGNTYAFELLDMHNQKFLAGDKEKKALLFIDLGHSDERKHFVNMNGAKSCKIVEPKYAGSSETARINFEISFESGKNIEIIPFYDADDTQLRTVYVYEELKQASKWEKMIADYI